jgi:hypothetical protein
MLALTTSQIPSEYGLLAVYLQTHVRSRPPSIRFLLERPLNRGSTVDRHEIEWIEFLSGATEKVQNGSAQHVHVL